MRSPLAAPVLLALGALVAPSAPAQARPAPPAYVAEAPATPSTAAPARPVPALRVRTVLDGLDHPWDVRRLPGAGLLVSERDRATLTLLEDDGTRRVLDFPSEEVWVSGETGLMGLEVDPDFRTNRRFYTCQGGVRAGGGHDVRVRAWRLSADATRARPAGVLVRGIRATSGRHGGCRLLITRAGALLVGTGDAAVGTGPRDLRSLGGKVLRVDRFTGRGLRSNPWSGAEAAHRRLLLTYGHRNVQGLAQRADGSLWSVEHGPDRDDEVNLLRPGGDYGWNPVPRGGGAGYDESVPMTDHRLPGRQRRARWRSGTPTLATSGATFVRGAGWGVYGGTLAVAALKAERVLFQRYDRAGRLTRVRAPLALRGLGRLRSVTRAPGGALLLTTDGRADGDRVLKVTPR